MVDMAFSARRQSRDRRFQLRATVHEEKLIRVAAQRRGVNVTDFILGAAREKAEAALADQTHFVLADQTHFVLDDRQWKRFMDALDQPPRVIPQIRKLRAVRSMAESR
jgi:uncharacterized protein (DUF1778 family)